MMSSALDSFLRMRSAHNAYEVVKSQSEGDSAQRMLALRKYFTAKREAIEESNEASRKRRWDESRINRHPAGSGRGGQFAPKDGSSGGVPNFSNQQQAKSWLTSSGAIGEVEGVYPTQFLQSVARGMQVMRDEYPSLSLKRMRVIDSDDEFMGIRHGTLEVSSGLLADTSAYADMNDYVKGMSKEDFTEQLLKQAEGERTRKEGRPHVSRNLEKAAALIDSGAVKPPRGAFVSSSIEETLVHEMGHLAMDKSRRDLDMLGDSVDLGMASYNEFTGPEMLKSALGLSKYAAESVEEYFAEAWCAYHTGKEKLLDDFSRSMVAAAAGKLKGA